ncbi:M20 family metallo-hydrolase [Pusillimonas noertemannii]|uniref:N-carbamoyl-L-amino-acid hydrolase n=1 Tax=Pusillimonas noertemannii TaxID=305977 RepID=A0A2U1CH19_9BURK|nr:M20 family metallo-hydrolase [Pusillimonas noertemannii]NYT68219.1 M20 family metallo-hydrolase [Pusillimonas noertemannii]PVY60189.1 N-carbamoyl-L-amino-acid hydrolase [Pusillimonas noertemannii]TFL10300.1 Zn-dependent hydrolase [Pusillimonas noertemannii]
MSSAELSQTLCVDGRRLWQSLEQMGELGATPTGGVRRLALSREDKLARDMFVSLCRASGYAVRIDALGNIYARRPGRDESLAPVTTGSHLDSQPVAGKYDGPYGVLAGLEALRSLDQHGVSTRRPIELIVWTNEEGARFQPVCMSSAAVAGVFPVQQALDAQDADGVCVGDALQTIGYAGPHDPVCPAMHCYIEAHIEQGPVLEREGLSIGAVEGVIGIESYEVTLTGQAAHIGTTPMSYRRDALAGAARIIHAVRQLGQAYEPAGRASCSSIQVLPNVRSVIAQQAKLTADCRHENNAQLQAMHGQLRELFTRIAEEEGLALQLDHIWTVPPTHFAPRCVEAVRAASAKWGYGVRKMYSGAAHDAMHIARIAPTGMIFIPCKDGVSHNEAELITPEDAAAGANVLLHTLVALANGD